MIKADDDLAPLHLVPPYESGADWSLCLSDSNSPLEVFEAAGHSGNGYAWDSVARVVAAKLDSSVGEAIDYDSEAGTFVAIAANPEPLRALGRALANLVRDHEALTRAIEAVPEDDWDD